MECITLVAADIQWNYKTEYVVTIGILKFPFRTDFYLKQTKLAHFKVELCPKLLYTVLNDKDANIDVSSPYASLSVGPSGQYCDNLNLRYA